MTGFSQIQKEILHKAVETPIFTKEVLTKCPLTIFGDNDIYKELSTIIKRYYQTKSNRLTENTLLTLTEEKLDRMKRSSEDQQEYFNTINDLYAVRDSGDDSVIDEKIEGYIKKHMRMEVLKKAVVSLEDESAMEQVDKDWKDIMLLDISGRSREVVNIIDDREYKERVLSTLRSNTMSTGFHAIDRLNGGGLSKGELGMILAISGTGKTLSLINLATNYTRMKRNVLFVSLEELENQMVLKFEQAMLRQSKRDLLTGSSLNTEHFGKLQDFYQKQRTEFGNLFFARYSPQTVTPAKIEQLISDITIREGVQLDVVLIDYPDLLRNPQATGNEAQDGGRLYEDMRRIGQDYNVAMWVASQMNRGAFSAEIKTSANIEGGLRKRNVAEIVLAVNQAPEEFDAGFIRFYADKLRNPPEGSFDKMVGFKVDGATMTMRDYQGTEEEEHRQLLADIDNDNEQGFKNHRREKSTPAPDYGAQINASISRGRE